VIDERAREWMITMDLRMMDHSEWKKEKKNAISSLLTLVMYIKTLNALATPYWMWMSQRGSQGPRV
jgi:hypothetical protein